MSLNINKCKQEITDLKENIKLCFQVCQLKNSTYTPKAQTIANDELFNAIGGIPTGSGTSGTSGSVTGQSCSGFPVTWADDTIDENGNLVTTPEFTIDFSSIGVGWKSIVCYSNTVEGYFSIVKISSTRCLVSAISYWSYQNETGTGYDRECNNTFKCRYVINGNLMTITEDTPDMGIDTSGTTGSTYAFIKAPIQIQSNFDWTTQIPETRVQYQLDLINIGV